MFFMQIYDITAAHIKTLVFFLSCAAQGDTFAGVNYNNQNKTDLSSKYKTEEYIFKKVSTLTPKTLAHPHCLATQGSALILPTASPSLFSLSLSSGSSNSAQLSPNSPKKSFWVCCSLFYLAALSLLTRQPVSALIHQCAVPFIWTCAFTWLIIISKLLMLLHAHTL